jgi:hypothetical protein
MTMQQPRHRDGDEANLPPSMESRNGNHHKGQHQKQLNGYKTNIDERIPLNSNKTSQQNRFYGGVVVEKDATMPKSNLTDRYFCTSAPQKNIQIHNNDEVM